MSDYLPDHLKYQRIKDLEAVVEAAQKAVASALAKGFVSRAMADLIEALAKYDAIKWNQSVNPED